MKKYDSFKDSGIEWIGDIPEHWESIKFNYVTSLMTCGHAATPIYVEEGGAPFLSAQNIKKEKIDLSVLKHISIDLHDSLIKNKKVEKGDLLQVRVGGADTIGQTAIVDLDFEFSIYVSLAHIKLNELAFNVFIKHLCNSLEFKNFCGVLMKTGAGVANLNVSDVQRMKIPLPPIKEQIIIGSFLDHKSNQIDSLISKKEQFITLLQEERIAVINQAVTKGIDPKVKMKDSGIEWLGEIPEHWEVKKLKHIVTCNNISLSEKTNPVEIINYIEIGDVNFEKGITGFTDYEFNKAPSRARRIVKTNDVIVSTVRTYLKAIATIEENFDGFIASTGFAVLTPNINDIHFKFLSYFTFTNGFIDNVISLSKGVSYPSITSQDLLNIILTIPNSIEEQKKISAFLDEKTGEINTIISKSNQEIELLKEYKTALISEVVTGKVDVREEIVN